MALGASVIPLTGSNPIGFVHKIWLYPERDDELQTKTIAVILIVMVWLSALVIWAVDKIDNTLPQSLSISNMPSGPILTTQSMYTVPVGNNTVWIIDTAHETINIITHDSNGYHSKLVSYDTSSSSK